MEPDLGDKEKSLEIIVRVTDPQPDQAGGFTTYLVSGSDQLGTFEIRRRYNDFFYFREGLKKKWPGLFIPPIPEKKLTGNKQTEHVEMRRKFFEYFMVRLATKKHLFYCAVAQDFLRTKGLDMEKHFQSIGIPPASELSQEYRKVFGEEVGNKSQAELRNITNNFYVFLKKAEKEVKTMRSQLAVVVQARQSFVQNLDKCNEELLPEYEKQIYSQYVSEDKASDGLLFVHNHKVQDNIRNLRDQSKFNPFEIALDMITYEVREIEAMEQAIVTRETYENNKKKLEQKCLDCQAEVAKLTGGKTTFKSIFSRGTKSEQIQTLEKSIPDMQKQIESMNVLCEIINNVLGNIEIPQFKREKQHQYYEMLEKVSGKELEFLGAYGQFMKSVMDGLSKDVK